MSELPDESSTVSTRHHRGRGVSRIIIVVILLGSLVALGVLLFKTEKTKRHFEQELQKTESELQRIKESTQGNGEEFARTTLEKVRKHIDIPTEPQPTVATIIDINKLRESNEFYNKGENDDILVLTDKIAILYSLKRDIVLNVAPVALESPSASPAAATSSTAIPPTTTPLRSPTTKP